MTEDPYWVPKNIRHHHIQFSHLGDLAPRICAPID